MYSFPSYFRRKSDYIYKLLVRSLRSEIIMTREKGRTDLSSSNLLRILSLSCHLSWRGYHVLLAISIFLFPIAVNCPMKKDRDGICQYCLGLLQCDDD